MSERPNVTVLPRHRTTGATAEYPRVGTSLVAAWRSANGAHRSPSVFRRRLRTGAVTHSDLAVAILVVSGVVVWWASSATLPLEAMTDIGIASVLPRGMWLGFLLTGAAFFVALRAGRVPAIVLSVAATVLVLHGLGVIAEPEMRFHVAWRHIGIADFIRDRGHLDPELDAYQSWPAFFVLTAVVWEATGLGEPSGVLAWAPVVYNLLYLLPLVAIGYRVLGDRTVVWLAAWLFTVSNWIGQDYFSPQGWYEFVYLVVLAVVVEWFAPDRPGVRGAGRYRGPGRRPGPFLPRRWTWPPMHGVLEERAATPGQRSFLLALVLLLSVAVLGGHQLTPFALALGAGAAVLVGWCRVRTLPVILLLATLLWTGYAAAAYVTGHPEEFNQIGAIASIFQQTVEQHLGGSPGHELVVQLRLLETPVLWALAALGLVRLARSGRRPAAWGLAALALSSFPLLLTQSYGGEALMRIAFFALMFMALLAAVGLVGPAATTARRRVLVPAVLVGALLVGLFPLTRYGNERMDWKTPVEVAGVQAMYALAPPGSVITSVTGSLPWRSVHYGDYDYRLLVDGDPVESDPDIGPEGTADMANPDLALLVEQVKSRMISPPGQRSYLVLSRSQDAELDLMGPFPPGTHNRLLAALQASPSFRKVYTNEDVTVFQLMEGRIT